MTDSEKKIPAESKNTSKLNLKKTCSEQRENESLKSWCIFK